MKKFVEAIKVGGKKFGGKALVIGGLVAAALAIGVVATRSSEDEVEELPGLEEAACASEDNSVVEQEPAE